MHGGGDCDLSALGTWLILKSSIAHSRNRTYILMTTSISDVGEYYSSFANSTGPAFVFALWPSRLCQMQACGE